MNKTLKWSAVVLVAIGLYVGGTLFTRTMAHARVEEFSNYLTAQSNGLVRLVEVKSTQGFLSSIEDITLALDNPLFTSAFAMATGGKPLQFTIHNVIQHGPLPGLRSVGIARVESTLVMDDATRKWLIDTLGTDKPIELSVGFGFDGGTTLNITSPALTIHLPKDSGTVEWKGMKSSIDFARHFASFKSTASAPGIVVNDKDGTNVNVDTLKMKSALASKFDAFYVGEGAVTIDSIDVTQSKPKPTSMHVKNAGYSVKLASTDDFLDTQVKMGAERFESAPTVLKDVHFNFALNHLHGPSAAELYKGLQSTAKLHLEQPNESSADFEKLKSHLTAVLKNAPEFLIENAGFATDDGDLKISAVVRFVKITDEDLNGPNVMQILSKIFVAADVSVSQTLLERPPVDGLQGFTSQATEFEKRGYLIRKGDRFETHIEYMNGKLVANGKAM